MARAMHAAVDEVGAVVEREQIDCGWAKGGALIVARNRGQLARLRQRQAVAERYGYGDASTMLDAGETTAIVRMDGAVGASMTPHAAALHPARLAPRARLRRRASRRRHPRAHQRCDPSTAGTCAPTEERCAPRGRARHRGLHRVAPRARASDPAARQLRRRHRADRRRHVGDDRPRPPRAVRDRREHGRLRAAHRRRPDRVRRPQWTHLVAVAHTRFADARPPRRASLGADPAAGVPAVARHRFHAPLGRRARRATRPAPRASATTAAPGSAWAGGYFGQGVASANAAGRTLADLVCDVDSEMARLPWVGHQSPPWEPEPLRWLGVHAVAALAHARDWIDTRRS